MSQPEKRENSVLFSLRELQKIEEDRISEEEEANRRAEEERIRAEMEAQRRAREEQEARERAIEDARRREQEDRERLEREERIRVQEAEARARAEHQARLEQERLAHELDLRRQEVAKKRPTTLIAIAAILVVAVAGLGYWAYTTMQEKERVASEKKRAEEDAEREAKARKEAEKAKAALEKELNELTQQLASAKEQFAAAKTKEEREAAQKRVRDLERRIQRRRSGSSGGSKKPRDKTIKLSPACIKNPLDPSCRR